VSALRGFGDAEEDAAFLKYTSFGSEGKYKLSIRVEFYNLLNRHYFDPPNTNIASPQFGYVTGIGGSPRNGQFGARFTW
jgi:outer membrane receptor protein involved in Fe transport